VQNFFQQEKPDYVILAAAKVGGIHANNTYPADFIYQNMMIEANIINSAYENKVKRLLFLGSTCIYPKAVEQPMREDALLTDVLEPTNESYALAKIAGIKLCESYNRQYGTDFRSVMPTNLYGEGDNFNLENSHVIPAVMRKLHLAKCLENNDWQAIRDDINKNPIQGITDQFSNDQIRETLAQHGIKLNIHNTTLDIEVEIWGSGKAHREFLHVSDMAEASLFVLGLDEETYQANTKPMLSHINVGSGKDVTIREMAKIMKEVVGYKGNITFDTRKPDGAPRKLIDVSRLSNMGWNYSVDLKDGLGKTYDWYLTERRS
jgi:GDP-L-fucose synthase